MSGVARRKRGKHTQGVQLSVSATWGCRVPRSRTTVEAAELDRVSIEFEQRKTNSVVEYSECTS